MSSPRKGEFILFKTNDPGPPVPAVADQVRATEGLELLHESPTALLVTGTASTVKSLTGKLDGWRSELNGKVSA